MAGHKTRLTDVAAAAGVSISAASVALNGRPGVSDSTRARIEKAAKKLGYVADAAAASLRSGRTRLVALVADDPAGPVVAALSLAASEAGVLLVVAPPDDVAHLLARGVDGIAVVGSDKAATAWSRTGRPLVILGDGRLPRGATRVEAGDAGQAATEVVAALTA